VNVLALVSTRLDATVIGRALGARALGLYSVAFRVPELLIESVAWNLSLVAFPALARKRVLDEQGLGPATLKLVRYQALYALPLSAGLAALSAPLVNVLFSSRWRDAAGVLTAVAVMAALSAVAFPLGDVFKAVGRQRRLVVLNIVQLPLLAVAVLVAASSGIVAVGWARAAGMALWAVMTMASASRELGIETRRTIAAAGPGAGAALGVLLGAGAIRLVWTDLSIWPLMTGIAAGVIGGACTLRLLAPAMFSELRGMLGDLRRALARRGRRSEAVPR
jgi:PST family polysaccharide transporter